MNHTSSGGTQVTLKDHHGTQKVPFTCAYPIPAAPGPYQRRRQRTLPTTEPTWFLLLLSWALELKQVSLYVGIYTCPNPFIGPVPCSFFDLLGGVLPGVREGVSTTR